MRTTDKRVWRNVMLLAKRRGVPGCPITKEDLRTAYRIVRANAIVDTVLWKRLNILIEETNI
jgi:hypothetical protein